MTDHPIHINIELEMAVVGAMISASLHGEDGLIDCVRQRLKVEDFGWPQCNLIASTIYSMRDAGEEVDELTVRLKLEKNDTFELAGGPVFYSQCFDASSFGTSIPTHAKIIKDLSVKRGLMQFTRAIESKINNPDVTAEQAKSAAFNMLTEVDAESRTSELIGPQESTARLFDRLEYLSENQGKAIGYSTGLKESNFLLQGVQKKSLWIIAGRPSSGKSAFVMQLAFGISRQYRDHTAIIFSIEMSNEIVMMRAASNAARVHLGELMQAKLQPEEWDRLGSLGKNLSVETPEICETPIIRLSDIRNHCRIVERTKPVSVVVIDYLQLLTHEGDNKGDTEALKVGRLAKGLAAIAKDFNCGVIALSQLNRASETRNDKHPTLSDLRESGTIEAAADVVLGLTKSSSFTPDVKIGDYEIVDVDVLKQRNGRLGRMHFRFEGQYMTFSDCDQADYDQLENKRSPKPAAKKKPEPALNEPKSEGRFANLDVDEMMEGY